MLFTAHLAPLHPDTHAIYEDNCRTCRAPLEHSLMDVRRARKKGQREEARVEGKPGSCDAIWFSLNSSMNKTRFNRAVCIGLKYFLFLEDVALHDAMNRATA